jgi:hypothetical protein
MSVSASRRLFSEQQPARAHRGQQHGVSPFWQPIRTSVELPHSGQTSGFKAVGATGRFDPPLVLPHRLQQREH